jgi:hypothetical protein
MCPFRREEREAAWPRADVEPCTPGCAFRTPAPRLLSVRNTDNKLRVRDGYERESTCGHARTLPTRSYRLISRTNVLASGKEGVDGSSPSEGLAYRLLKAGLCCLR